MSSTNGDEFDGVLAEELKKDVSKKSGAEGLADIVASGRRQRQKQQKTLFCMICWLVGLSFAGLILLVLALGLEWIKLESAAQVAGISALGVQPFVLIGILTRGVFRGDDDMPKD